MQRLRGGAAFPSACYSISPNPKAIQHSPEAKTGRDGFKEFAVQFFAMKPHMHVFKIAEDGDMVFVFFKCTFGDQKNAAKVCDIYRLENGKLAEHWDVLQSIDPDDPGVNGNGHF